MDFKNTPIQHKLMRVILLTCSAVLLLMSSAYILVEYLTLREVLKKNVTASAMLIATNSSAALAFDSPKDATEILNGLKANKHIVVACLYDKEGNLFAKYPGTLDQSDLPPRPGTEQFSFTGSFLQGFQPVIVDGKSLGTFYLKRDVKDMYAHLRLNALIAFVMILISLLVAWLISSILQKSILQPIQTLERTAKEISQNNDYSVRATKTSDDEIGSLTDAFNQMLTQIETQNLEISKANEESSKLAAIVESSGDAIVGTSLDLIITTWNDSAARIFGYPAEAMVGTPLSKAFSQELIQHAQSISCEPAYVESFESEFITGDKKTIDISLTISPVRDALQNAVGLSLIVRDITQQKQTERLVIENEEHLRLATEAGELGTFDMDIPNDIMNWDKNCRNIFGVGHDIVVNYQDHFLSYLHKDDKQRISEAFQAVATDGSSSSNYNGEYRIIRPDNNIRWVRAMGRVDYDVRGIPVRSLGILLDITDKKNEEVKKNDFISIISHELRTPLTSLKSYVQVLLARAKKEHDGFRISALTRAEVQANKMAAMIDDFLSLAKIEEGRITMTKEKFELFPLLSSVVEDALLTASTHKILLNKCADVIIEADKDKLGHVLINLISNAVKYSPQGSTISIDCQKVDGQVKVSVSDQGIGISKNDQKKLFTRFYRVENEKTKTVSGFGIGLYIVSEILKSHNSSVDVESIEGQGSTFSFYLEEVS